MLVSQNRILIFGDRGYLGSSILRKLNHSTGIGINSIEDLSYSILNNVDIIVNCAGASNVSESIVNPEIDFTKNTLLVFQLLEKIRQSGNINLRFINFSSAAVYGNPQLLPINENSITKPISPYGYHKRMAEDICREYSRCFGMKTISLRIFSVYGIGQRKMLMWDLNQKILNSEGEIILFGTGDESRDFIHIDDVIQQLILAFNHAEFQGEAINVANGTEVRVKEIVELYRKLHSSSFDYTFNEKNRPGDPLNWCADISKMKEWGYNQTVSIHDGVEGYIKWALSNK
jgi:dTDP-glucose 4,6-dehydratase/UDP-glucose 4-epimerase